MYIPCARAQVSVEGEPLYCEPAPPLAQSLSAQESLDRLNARHSSRNVRGEDSDSGKGRRKKKEPVYRVDFYGRPTTELARPKGSTSCVLC